MERSPAVAGMFYSSDAEELRKQIEDFLANVKEKHSGKVHGIVAPHAGLIYSGQTAAYAYSVLPDTKKIVLLGPSHYSYISNAVIDNSSSWKTPLGEIKVSKDANKIADVRYITLDSEPHRPEHSLEVQIPFLQVHFDAEIIPILVGDVNDESAQKIAEILLEKCKDCVFIISTDLSHFHDVDTAKMLDKATIKSLETLDTKAGLDACGKNPLLVAMHMCKIKNWKMKLLHYSTSGDTSGDYNNVVGYAALVF